MLCNSKFVWNFELGIILIKNFDLLFAPLASLDLTIWNKLRFKEGYSVF